MNPPTSSAQSRLLSWSPDDDDDYEGGFNQDDADDDIDDDVYDDVDDGVKFHEYVGEVFKSKAAMQKTFQAEWKCNEQVSVKGDNFRNFSFE